MSLRFVKAMSEEDNWKLTENLADSLRSTKNSLLDLFATVGALRTREEKDIERLFSLAFSEDKLLALKLSFYARNIRGGLGERRTSRIIWKWLALHYPEIMLKNLYFIPFFGRWDDLYEFVDTPVEKEMWNLVKEQWKIDNYNMRSNSKNVSLLAKWLKSTNTSSEESCKLGKLTANHLGLFESSYRRALSRLRNYLNITEKRMSSKLWNLIDYEHVPSKAMNNYRKAFAKRDNERFSEYITKVSEGKAKINSSTLYPYDIVEKVMLGEDSKVLEEQWKALPNYIEGEHNILIMADVSGSMRGRPIATSIGLAIYFAERNKGIFHNKFMTFSEEPDFVELKGNTLYTKILNVEKTHWDLNTDIEKAFHRILKVAVENKLSQEELPESLIIITDMEFDRCTRSGRKTYYQHMKELYTESGYILPRVVFWNVDARQNTFHATIEDGVQFASGQATSVFKSLLDNKEVGPYELMLNVLNDPMYSEITI